MGRKQKIFQGAWPRNKEANLTFPKIDLQFTYSPLAIWGCIGFDREDTCFLWPSRGRAVPRQIRPAQTINADETANVDFLTRVGFLRAPARVPAFA